VNNMNTEKKFEFDSLCGHFRHGRFEQARTIYVSFSDKEREDMFIYFSDTLCDQQLAFDVRKKFRSPMAA
jgi:hypothetical protein